jgi:hypothetical protein
MQGENLKLIPPGVGCRRRHLEEMAHAKAQWRKEENSAPQRLCVSEKPNVPYEEIGRVSVDKYNNLSLPRSSDEMNAAMKQQAASIGGNAIIDVTEDFASMSGVVVAFKSESK